MKEEMLTELSAKILAGELYEDYFFTTMIFFYLAGGFPNATIADCADVVEAIRDEYLYGTGFKKGESK